MVFNTIEFVIDQTEHGLNLQEDVTKYNVLSMDVKGYVEDMLPIKITTRPYRCGGY